MKIIKRGTLPAETTYKVTCNNCHSQIEFMESEGKVQYDQRDGNFVTFNCPVCRRDVHTALNRDRSIG